MKFTLVATVSSGVKMNKQIDKIRAIQTSIKELQADLKVYLIDKNVRLEDRWEVYSQACKENIACEEDGWGPSLKTLEELGLDSPYDYLTLIENLEDRLDYEPEKGIWSKINLTQEAIDTVKEEILTRFPERGYRYDW